MFLFMFGPDEVGQPLCSFSRKARLVPTGATQTDYAALCPALAAEGHTPRLTVAAADPGLQRPDRYSQAYKRLSDQPRVAGVLEADVFNTGDPLQLVWMTFSSGAGPGCGASFFDLSDDPMRPTDEDRDMRAAFMGAQRMGDELGLVPFCGGGAGTRSIFEWRGKTYIHFIRRRHGRRETIARMHRLEHAGSTHGRYSVVPVCEFIGVSETILEEVFLNGLGD